MRGNGPPFSSKNSGLGFPGIAAYLHNETPGLERRYLGSPPGGRIYDTVLDVDGKQDGGGVARADYRPRGLLWRFFVPGGYNPDKIIMGLAPHFGQPDNHLAGFHVFTFNDLGPTEAWRQQSLRRLHLQAGRPAPARAGAGTPGQEHA